MHITPLGGMAGDMFVAAMLDAMPDLVAEVGKATAAVLPGRNASLAECTKFGLAARHFAVPLQDETAPLNYSDMDDILANARMPEMVVHHARALLRLLGLAEAKVHRVPLEKVHFHEIADWDTLADLAGAAALLAALDGWSWSFAPLPTGNGTIETQHGRLPVPAPATASLLQGLMVQDDGIGGERVTPTGATIVRYIHDYLPMRPRPMGRLDATGYGAGTRDLPGLANVVVVQVIRGEVQPGDTVSVLEWDIDDMTGEEIAVACEHLRAAEGVLDLVTQSLSGKKCRPVIGFRLMALPAHVDSIATTVFAQTTTLGLRLHQDQRLVLPRRATTDAKSADRPHATTIKAESDAIAAEPTLAARRSKAREIER